FLLNLRCVRRTQRLEAGGVEGDREAAFLRGFPHRVPQVRVERDRHALEGEVSAAQAHLRAAAYLRGGVMRVVVRDEREREHAFRVRTLREVRGPVVVLLVAPEAELSV